MPHLPAFWTDQVFPTLSNAGLFQNPILEGLEKLFSCPETMEMVRLIALQVGATLII
jgi:hypothetical protein